MIQDHEKVKFSGQDVSSLAAKGFKDTNSLSISCDRKFQKFDSPIRACIVVIEIPNHCYFHEAGVFQK